MKGTRQLVLLVDDNEDAASLVGGWLNGVTTMGHEVEWVTNLELARAAFAERDFDICLLDDSLGGRTGLELLRDFSGYSHPPIILLGDREDFEVDLEAARLGAYDYLVKSHTNALLLERSIRYAVQRKASERALARAQNFAQATVDALPDQIAVLDEHGEVVAVNAAWRNFSVENGFAGARAWTGTNYLQVCETGGTAEGLAAAAGIRAVMSGEQEIFTLEYTCPTQRENRWFEVRVTRFAGPGPSHVVVAHSNVTARKGAESGLKSSAADLAKSQEMAHLGSWVNEYFSSGDRRSKKVVWSDETFRIFGWLPGEVEASAEKFLRAVHPEDRVLVQNAASRYQSDPAPFSCDYRVLRPDDSVRLVHQEAVPVFDEGGCLVRTIGTIQDVTERRRDEQLLREREEFQRELLENFPNGSVTVFDRELRYVMTAGHGLQLTSQNIGDLIGKRRPEIFPGEQTDWAVAHYERALAGEKVEFELEIRGLFFNVVAVPLKDDSGEIANILAVSQDITARKTAETRLRNSESDLAASQGRAHLGSLELDFVISTGAHDRRRWSDEAFRILGYEPGEVEPSAQILMERVHPEDRHLVEAAANRPIRPHEPFQLEPRLLLPDGTVRWVHLQYEFLFNDAGQVARSVGTIQDITERKQAENQRDRFFTLSQDLLLITGFDGYFKRVNPAFFETLGFTEAELTATPFLNFVHPDDVAATLSAFQGFFRGEAVTGFENRYLCKDGSWRWIDWKAVPVTDEGLAYAAGRDITERKVAETALLLLRDELELRVEERTAELARANATLQVEIGERMAAEAETRARARQQETVAELGRRALADSDLETLLNTATELAATTLGADLCTYLELTPAGERFGVRAATGWSEAIAGSSANYGIPVQGSQAGYALASDSPLIVHDLPSETRFRPSPILLMQGVKSGVSVIVRGYERPFGVMAAHSFAPREFTQDDIHFLEAMANVLGVAIERHSIESEMRDLNGQLSVTNEKLMAENAERQIALGALREASEVLKEANEAAECARKSAEVANLAKSEFLSRMSHELRTPLNAILGFGQLMALQKDLGTDEQENVDQILKAGRHLLDLINEVLDISRIESGHLLLSPEPVAVGPVVRQAVDLVRPLASSRHIALINEIGEPGGDWQVVADQQRLKQVLLNLLSNAVKYNRVGGRVKMTCEATMSVPRVNLGRICGGTLRVTVQDTGDGLSSEDIDRLFVPFERLGAARTQIEGTGIGLSLCKRLVEAMGGRVGVDSEVGRGSAFWFELPLAGGGETLPSESNGSRPADMPPSNDAVVMSSGVSRKAKTVLYIEDNLSNINLIKRVLSDIDSEIQLLAALQGSRGLDLAAEQQPDLILLDVHLPDILGDAVLARLKTNPVTRHIPVVVLTADAMPRQKEKMMTAGASYYLTKPLDIPQFYGVLRETLGEASRVPS